MNENVIKAALLGFGTVGTGVYKVLKNQEKEMSAKIGGKVEIKKILVRNIEKAAAYEKIYSAINHSTGFYTT